MKITLKVAVKCLKEFKREKKFLKGVSQNGFVSVNTKDFPPINDVQTRRVKSRYEKIRHLASGNTYDHENKQA